MQPVSRITLHHDGIGRFTSTSHADAAQRLDAIRRAHRNRPTPFGDIGYHFAIDPAGRVWQGRPLAYQGAHVAAQNRGNLGICILGNYELQQPTATQEHAIAHLVHTLATTHRLQRARIHTHRELAPTACPGRYLQPRIANIRAALNVAHS